MQGWPGRTCGSIEMSSSSSVEVTRWAWLIPPARPTRSPTSSDSSWDLVPAWGNGLTGRVTGRPKVALLDTRPCARLNNPTPAAMSPGLVSDAAGDLFEAFVAGELRRQFVWTDADVGLFHFVIAMDERSTSCSKTAAATSPASRSSCRAQSDPRTSGDSVSVRQARSSVHDEHAALRREQRLPFGDRRSPRCEHPRPEVA